MEFAKKQIPLLDTKKNVNTQIVTETYHKPTD